MRQVVACSFCDASIARNPSKSGRYFCCTSHKAMWQTIQREKQGFTKEWLIEQYIINGKSSNQIAREVGRDPKRVWEWIRDYGIETRPRGSDYGQLFKVGEVSRFSGRSHSVESRERFRQLRLADGRKPYMKDGKHWLKHDGARPPNWKGGISPERQSFYASEEWADAVKAVWARDNAVCQRCGKKHNTESARGTFAIHHIVSFRVKELRAEPSNLVLLCRSCHLWVHSRQNTDRVFIKDIDNELH